MPASSETTPPTTEELRSDGLIGCDEQSQTIVGFLLEVDTAVGKTEFNDDLVLALSDAFSAEYSFCSNARRSGQRRLEDALDEGLLIGGITISNIEQGALEQ